LIEIGSESPVRWAVKQAASIVGSVTFLLLLVWLLRGILSLSAYSFDFLVIIFGLIFLKGALDTRTNLGARRAVSSFLWNIVGNAIFIIILIWVLGWIAGIQSDSLPGRITQQVPNLAITAVIAGIVGYIAYQIAPKFGPPRATGPAIQVNQSSTLNFGEVQLSPRKDSAILQIKGNRKTLGAVVLGDVTATFDTPMGKVTGSIPGPVTTLGIPFRGEKAASDEISKLTGKTLAQLLDETRVDASLPRGEIFAPGFDSASFGEEKFEFPFGQARRTSDKDTVDVGPISVSRRRREEDDVEVGPFSFNPCDWSNNEKQSWFKEDRGGMCSGGRRRRISSRWLAKGSRGSTYLAASPDGVQARWNGSSLRVREGSMKMAVGSDGFVYSPTELQTYSPLHMLEVTPSKAVLNTKKFTLNISGSKVILRSDDGSKVTESPEMAKDLIELLTQTANKQVRAVMDGLPMELDDMFAGTEEVLKKHE
jgi:hypothetical protein